MTRATKPGSYSFADAWPNTKVARVVALICAGRSSIQIADALDDGTTPGTISKMSQLWGVPLTRTPYVKAELTIRGRQNLIWRAERRGMTPEQYAGEVLTRIAADDEAIFGKLPPHAPPKSAAAAADVNNKEAGVE